MTENLKYWITKIWYEDLKWANAVGEITLVVLSFQSCHRPSNCKKIRNYPWSTVTYTCSWTRCLHSCDFSGFFTTWPQAVSAASPPPPPPPPPPATPFPSFTWASADLLLLVKHLRLCHFHSFPSQGNALFPLQKCCLSRHSLCCNFFQEPAGVYSKDFRDYQAKLMASISETVFFLI